MGLRWIKALRMVTGHANVIGHLDHVLALLASGRLDPAPLVTHHMTLADAAEAYALYDRREALKIVLEPPHEHDRRTARPALRRRPRVRGHRTSAHAADGRTFDDPRPLRPARRSPRCRRAARPRSTRGRRGARRVRAARLAQDDRDERGG